MKAKCCRNSAFSHKMGEFNRTGRERQVEEVHVDGRVEMMTPVAMIRDNIKNNYIDWGKKKVTYCNQGCVRLIFVTCGVKTCSRPKIMDINNLYFIDPSSPEWPSITISNFLLFLVVINLCTTICDILAVSQMRNS